MYFNLRPFQLFASPSKSATCPAINCIEPAAFAISIITSDANNAASPLHCAAISNACVSNASPANTAMPSPKTLCSSACRAKIVVVHRRQVLVDKRIGVDALRPRTPWHRILLFPSGASGRRQGTARAASASARKKRVAHCLVNGWGLGSRGWQNLSMPHSPPRCLTSESFQVKPLVHGGFVAKTFAGKTQPISTLFRRTLSSAILYRCQRPSRSASTADLPHNRAFT